MSQSKRLLIMAGGTGGHVYPALAVAELLRAEGHQVEWLGSVRGIENRVVPEAGIRLHAINVSGLRGKGKLSLIAAPFKLINALWQAYKVVKQVKPDAVLGMGGFASGPGALAAWLLNKPLVIHEQNAVAGLTNSQSRRFAKRVLQAFPNAFKSGAQGEVVGNPIRGPILDVAAPSERFAGRSGAINCLVVGGSLGALAINDLVPQAVARLSSEERPNLWHQSGPTHIERCQQAYADAGVEAEVVPYIESMDEAYAWADLVICRAGALTVSEIAIAGVPALFIPFPHAVDDHQTANAQYLVDAKGADLIAQKNLTAEGLSQWLKQHQSRTDLLAMANASRSQAKPDATRQVADICLEVAL
jgi:UDP-N-acetylglucosamine--N-acetylmuramyl-(pentapeptide) pyrophosphoryl-undecaprenol N-acetylglucosamine transferase